jgi:hypothetical protein
VKLTMMILLAVSCLGNTVALADKDASPDQICIIFDYPAGCRQNCGSPGFAAAFDGYVVLQNASDMSGVSGYEFRLCNPGGGLFAPPVGEYAVLEYELPPGAIPLSDPPEFVIGLTGPLAWEPCNLLMTIKLQSSGSNTVPWCFGVQPVTDPMIPGRMAYAGSDDPSDLLPMRPCTGPQADSCFMACVNDPSCPPPTGDETLTWGGLKALYR